MSVSALLTRLRHLNVRVWADAGQLRYEAPKGVMTTELLNELKAVKSELLDLLRQSQSDDVPPISPVPRDQSLPLSFSQQRLWLLDQITPGNPAYNVPLAMRLHGALDVVALERSLNEILHRHEILRTHFINEEGNQVQRILPELLLALPVEEVPGANEAEREAKLKSRIVQESLRPFDLASGPLIYALLQQLSAEEHVLLLVIHHVVFDRWSVNLLYRELAALYEAFQAEKPSPLIPQTIQYADFAVWQREAMQGPVLAAQLEYWSRRLQGAESLQLLTDRPRPKIQTFNGRRETRRIPARLLESLQELSRNEGATLFMTLLAAFQVLLQRYTGQDDVIVGSPIANRHRSDVEDMLGFFINMLALRTDLSGDPSFRELLGQIRTDTLVAYAHQDLPFERLVEELGIERELGSNPLIQVVFALQNAPAPPGKMGELRMEKQQVDNATTRFDLELHLEETQNGLTAIAVYNSDLFEWETIQRMLAHYETLLRGVVENADRRISELPLLEEAERAVLLTKWNNTETGYPHEATLHGLFAEWAARTPEAQAAMCGEVHLTYAELDARSNQLARALTRRGVVPGALVGLCLERTEQLPVGMLGILKAGAAYVPLDADYPTERLAFMLEDSQVAAVVTQASLRARLPGEAGMVLCLDTDELACEDDTPLDETASAESLAYIIYTSGSTGIPKGVAVPHRAVVRLVLDTNYVDLQPGDRISQASNASFDAATYEFWGALLNGGELVIASRELTLNPRAYAAFLRENKITSLFITTALFNSMAREAPGSFASLREVMFGGELVDPVCVRSVLKSGSPTRLLHVYGPTESTTFATWYLVGGESSKAGESETIPIGQPLSNTTLYVLDERLQPVPLGVPGELYVGGAGLAQGYWQRPELTAAAFVAHPFTDDPAARLYRTGDRVRQQADGAIVFVGRVDDQVKIRGFRIEPGEVEAVLTRAPGVREAIVVCREDGPAGERRLVGYVAPETVSFDTLRSFMRENFPDYMVPSAFVALDALPLNANGKVDRRALPAPDMSRQDETPFTAATTGTQRLLVEIWIELLGLDGVGLHENFFTLGGHSLMATQLVNRFEEYFDLDVPLITVFDSPTIAEQAARIDSMLLIEMENASYSGD